MVTTILITSDYMSMATLLQPSQHRSIISQTSFHPNGKLVSFSVNRVSRGTTEVVCIPFLEKHALLAAEKDSHIVMNIKNTIKL